jgi:PAS domain S-box-containing protein
MPPAEREVGRPTVRRFMGRVAEVIAPSQHPIMNVVATIWIMIVAACLTLAMVHLTVWMRKTRSLAHLAFACTAVSVAAFSVCNLAAMMARTPEEAGRAMWWLEWAVFAFILGSVVLLRTYVRAGPAWLAWGTIALRGVMLVWNFFSPYSANYSSIERLDRAQFLGETISIAVGTLSFGRYIGAATELGVLALAISGTVSAWRRGDRRRAVLVSGSLAVFMLVAAGQAWLVFHGIMSAPMYVVPAFIVVISTMSLELGGDVVRAAELTAVVQAREADLRESEERMDLAASATGLGLWIWDMKRDDIEVGHSGRMLFGVDATEKINIDRFFQTVHPDDIAYVQQRIADAVDGDGDYAAEYRIILPNGAFRWIAARGRIDHAPDGSPVRMLGVVIDITQRRLADERSQAIVEAAPSALLVVNREGVILIANAIAERTFGYARHELIGQKIENLIPTHLRQAHEGFRADYFAHPTMRTMGGGRDLYGRRKDGTEVPIDVGLTPVQIGQELCAIASVVDISERKRIDLELARQRNELAHLSRVTMLGELSGSLAHELNQPLASILSNAQAAQRFLAQQEPDLAEVREILQDIVDEDRRAGEIIYRLRALLRKGEADYRPVDVNALVDDSLRLIRSDLINQGVTCVTEYASDPLIVQGDRVQLQQVLINLVMNACDAMQGVPRGKRQLSVRCVATEGVCQVHVVDCGCGVPSDQLESIFNAFFTTKSAGMGLGLAVCRTIINAHRGRLWASNNDDNGLTVSFELQLVLHTTGEKYDAVEADRISG